MKTYKDFLLESSVKFSTDSKTIGFASSEGLVMFTFGKVAFSPSSDADIKKIKDVVLKDGIWKGKDANGHEAFIAISKGEGLLHLDNDTAYLDKSAVSKIKSTYK